MIDRQIGEEAYHFAAEPIIRKMGEIRAMYSVLAPIVLRPGATLKDARILPDQIRFELPPDAQELYSKYEATLEQLRGMFLNK